MDAEIANLIDGEVLMRYIADIHELTRLINLEYDKEQVTRQGDTITIVKPPSLQR